MLSNFGGLYVVLHGLCGFIATVVQRKYFYAKISRALYFTKIFNTYIIDKERFKYSGISNKTED